MIRLAPWAAVGWADIKDSARAFWGQSKVGLVAGAVLGIAYAAFNLLPFLAD